MRKIYIALACLCVMAGVAFFVYPVAFGKKTPLSATSAATTGEQNEENEGYDGPLERDALEFEKTKDPALGYVPTERLWNAIAYTNALKAANDFEDISVLWTERGPIYDSVGPSNGNGRGGGAGVTAAYTSGRIRAVLIDTLNDPTGNTVITAGVDGGVWKCTNFLSDIPNWHNISDYFSNMAVSSICQDPSNPKIMYFATGEPTNNSDAVSGKGIWKSTDAGQSWVQLGGTVNFTRNFKVLCDTDGNVFFATRVIPARTAALPVTQPYGLLRSKNGGVTWTNITPSTLSDINATCTDIELSSTGRLHASFGYAAPNGANITVSHKYTSDPANVDTEDWQTGIGIRTSSVVAKRLELACVADTLYGITTSAQHNIDSCYKSIDGGATWTKQNTAVYTTSLTNTQGWYNIALAINPDSTQQIIMGALDAYVSNNSGATISRRTAWVSTQPYVHADQHFIQWWKAGNESRVLIACDGGLYLSRDTGRTWKDRNRNLAIKQFYAADMHPTDENYLLAGAQDNGTHQLKNPGLSYSIEVTGGDGCLVHINQKKPSVQFASYVYNQYRRSINGGATWGQVNISSTAGLFVNPWDVDDNNNNLYASYTANQVLRWRNADTSTSAASRVVLTLNKIRRQTSDTSFVSDTVSAVKVSPYTPNRVYFGGRKGKLVILDNADTLTTVASVEANSTDITGEDFPTANLQCINVGTSDKYLVAVFTNYGVKHVWFSEDGGTSWTNIDGNLPDMPVRWAVFQPNSNDKLLLATEAGIYSTQDINGNGTQWMPSPGFPTVRTDMIRIRPSDFYMVAATHGRGLFTSNSYLVLPIRDLKLTGVLDNEGKSNLSWVEAGASAAVRYYIQYSTDGVTFGKLGESAATRYAHYMNAPQGYYRIMAIERGHGPVFSNVVMLKSNRQFKGLQLRLSPNPISSYANLVITGAKSSDYDWQISDAQGRTLQRGRGVLKENQALTQPVNVTRLPAGLYWIRVIQNKQTSSVSFIKQ